MVYSLTTSPNEQRILTITPEVQPSDQTHFH